MTCFLVDLSQHEPLHYTSSETLVSYKDKKCQTASAIDMDRLLDRLCHRLIGAIYIDLGEEREGVWALVLCKGLDRERNFEFSYKNIKTYKFF